MNFLFATMLALVSQAYLSMEKLSLSREVLLVIRMADTPSTCSGTIVTRMHVITNAQCLTRYCRWSATPPTAQMTCTASASDSDSSRIPRTCGIMWGGDWQHVHKSRDGATPRSVTVFYSSSEKYEGYRVRGSRILIHPDFSETTLSNDIALVMVESPFIQSTYTLPVCIPVEKFNIEGRYVVVAGWGQEYKTNRPQRTMYTTVVMVAPGSECRDPYKQFGFNETVMLCAKRVDENYCESDTGGPAVTAGANGRFYLVGLLSYSTSCSSQGERIYPSIFTKVDVFAPWISKFVTTSPDNYTVLME